VLHISQISLNNIRTRFAVAVHLQKFCQYSPKTVFFEPVQVSYQSFVSTAKWHITSRVYRSALKISIYGNIRNVCNTKHNLIFV